MDFLVNIDVPDLEKALAFYRDAFGLKVGRRFGDNGVELLGGPAPIYLLAKQAASAAVPSMNLPRDYERHWTPVHLDFVVSDIHRAVKRAVAAGAKLESEARAAAWGTIAMLSDPFGNGFCLLAFNEPGYDAIADPH